MKDYMKPEIEEVTLVTVETITTNPDLPSGDPGYNGGFFN